MLICFKKILLKKKKRKKIIIISDIKYEVKTHDCVMFKNKLLQEKK